MEPGDIVRLWSEAGFVYAFRRASDTTWKSPNLAAGTLGVYIGPNAAESKRIGQPMVDILIGDVHYHIDKRFLEAILI